MERSKFWRIDCALSVVVVAALVAGGQCAVAQEDERAVSDDVWQRTHRVIAYNSPRRARYPSAARNKAGNVVLLFTQATKKQEEAGVGDIMMIGSTDRGENWSKPKKIYDGKEGEPRTMGTLAALRSGDLVAVVAEMGEEPQPKRLCLLTSKDGGRRWKASDPLELSGMDWAQPYGRLLEVDEDTLLMPVYGALGAGDAEEKKMSSGLLQSRDGGQTWGDPRVIARGFTQPAVMLTGKNSLVALVTDGGSLYRCYSEDGGYYWTEPEQALLGREPYLVRISDELLACAASKGGGKWGAMTVSFSYDDFRSTRCDRLIMRHTGIVEGYYGWPAGVALDADHMLLCFGHTQAPLPQVDGPPAKSIPVEKERIEVVFYERDKDAPELPLAPKVTPASERDYWEPLEGRRIDEWQSCFSLTEDGEVICISGENDPWIWLSKNPFRVVCKDFGPKELFRSLDGGGTWKRQPMNLPPDLRGQPGLVTRLSSGRFLATVHEWLLVEWDDVDHKPTGEERGGYSVWNPDRKQYYKDRTYVIYSDDEGKTWQGTEKPIDLGGKDWAGPQGQFIELSDGTIVMPVQFNLNEEDNRVSLDSTGLFRSRDGGKTWGDFSVVAYDKENRWTAYNEMDIIPLDDRFWVAFLRTEYRAFPSGGGNMSRTITTDGGYTWTEPELCFTGSVPAAEVLPDGGIALGSSSGVHITYDLGRTWTRVLPVGGYVTPILVDNDTLLLSQSNNLNIWGTFDAWRRVPGKYRRWERLSKAVRRDPGLVAYYDFEQVTVGSTLKNKGSGSPWEVNTFDGTILDTSDVRGRWSRKPAMHFDGRRDHVTLPDNPGWDFGTGDCSIELWVKWEELPSSKNPGLVDFFSKNSNPAANRMAITLNDAGNGISVFHGAGGWRIGAVDMKLAIDAWYHIVMVRDGDNLSLYKNGIKAASATGAGGDDIQFAGGPAFIGLWGASGNSFFNGYMDEIAIYKRALTEEEIRRHYEIGGP